MNNMHCHVPSSHISLHKKTLLRTEFRKVYFFVTHFILELGMLEIYYKIWVDCMKRAKSQPANKQNWTVGSMVLMSISMAFNLALIMIVLQQYLLGYFFYTINMDFLPRQVNYLFNFIVLFLAPCVGLNYFLIFRNKRYEKLLDKYPYYNGKLFYIYFLISILLPIIL